jgi:hypothetical protein
MLWATDMPPAMRPGRDSGEQLYCAGVKSSMVTDCFGAREWDLSDAEAVFLQGSLSLLKVIIPLTVFFLLWRIYVTNKGSADKNISTLRLKENSADK